MAVTPTIFILECPMHARDQSRFQLKFKRFGKLRIDCNEDKDRNSSEVQVLV